MTSEKTISTAQWKSILLSELTYFEERYGEDAGYDVFELTFIERFKQLIEWELNFVGGVDRSPEDPVNLNTLASALHRRSYEDLARSINASFGSSVRRVRSQARAAALHAFASFVSFAAENGYASRFTRLASRP